MTTAQTIRETIENNVESTVLPEKLMQLIEQSDGKRLTKRLTDKWGKILDAELWIRKQYGMTHIDVNGYWRQQYSKVESEKHQLNFLIAHAEINVHIDAERIRESNSSSLAAAIMRNNARENQLKDKERIEELAQAIDECKDAQARIDELLPSFTDRYSIEKAVDLND